MPPDPPDEPSTDPVEPDIESSLALSRAAAARLGQIEWQLETEPGLEFEPAPNPAAPSPAATPVPDLPAPDAPVPSRPTAEPARPRLSFFPSRTAESEAPPPPDRILEALLFVGGPPLTPDAVAVAVRGLTSDQVREAVDRLNKAYRVQNRPYTIQPRDGGYVLVVKPAYRGVKEKLFGGPREARLGQPALDVLSLVAYRQPITKADVDALRGADSATVLRQLVRLGLIAVARRGEAGAREICYGTTSRFLDLFNLSGLDDLPRLVDAK
ncbi:SMC-Scp complex subunit ScpB [Fimbriiglobus ruber]|uniref:Segregation and condensation protein B n=1 Tax=Fimbriiglobus ruber TaxID=1908690 RepID=A0A225D7Q9_9BACT|nr:SMC-Scp complex subunit ScpB [Fimbriiglobus ruber]OWK37640.1 Segregation and condensation protein B [Fimbriiglobus ruber]